MMAKTPKYLAIYLLDWMRKVIAPESEAEDERRLEMAKV